MEQTSITLSNKTGTVRWYHLTLLVIFLVAGAQMRWHWIARENLWFDEYWSVYLATARAQPTGSVFDAPLNVVIDPAPPTDFHNAPPWWRIWTGMTSSGWGPMYHIALRWWVDIFGDSDAAMRSLSAVLDLACAVVLFEILRRTQGPWPGVLAAGLLCFSWLHIDQSQETRCYTLMAFFALLSCLSMFAIEQRGATAGRLVLLGISSGAAALTHYFCAGSLLALGLYALLKLRGRDRWWFLATTTVTMLLVAVTWGPYFIRGLIPTSAQSVYLNNTSGDGARYILLLALLAPMRLVLSPYAEGWLAGAAMAIFVYAMPIASFRRTRDSLFWWMWVIGGIGFVVGLDIARHTMSMILTRYVFIASPGVFALLATPLPMRSGFRWIVGITVLFCAICFAADRTTGGGGSKPGWQNVAQNLTKLSGPRDIIVFTPALQFSPRFTYVALRHYLPQFDHPIVLLQDGPPDAATLQTLHNAGHFWMIGVDQRLDMPTFFPQWRVDVSRPAMVHVMLWRVVSNDPVQQAP